MEALGGGTLFEAGGGTKGPVGDTCEAGQDIDDGRGKEKRSDDADDLT